MAWERYAGSGTQTSVDAQMWIGQTFQPLSFCCDTAGASPQVYLTKEPVCNLIMDPIVQFVNTPIAWDISNSYAPNGTIDSFEIAWGDTTDIGDLSSQNWAIDAKTGSVSYTQVGTYIAEATVTDTTGKSSKPCRVTIKIVPADEPSDLATVYVGTTDAGCFIVTAGGITQANTGLSGDDLKFRNMRLHPNFKDLASGQRHLWAATANGVAYSVDGAANWTTISKATLGTPENAIGDSPDPDTADLDQIGIAFDSQDWQRVYLLRTQTTPDKRAWLYYTDDYGQTWSNEQVVF